MTLPENKEEPTRIHGSSLHVFGEKVWDDAIAESYTSKVRTILIHLTDALGYDDTKEQREAFNKAFGELMKLYRNI